MLKMGLVTAVTLWTTTLQPEQGPMRWMYSYKVLEVIDGDTVKIEAKYLPNPLQPWVYLRIAGVDTAERGGKSKCERERLLAEEAAHFTENAISHAKTVEIEIKGHDKFGGRYLGDVWVDGRSLSEKLIEAKLGQHYYGEKKPDWCKR